MMTNSDWLFPANAHEAIAIQRLMVEKVVHEDAFGSLHWIGGLDVSNWRFDPSRRVFAAAVVLCKETKELQEAACAMQKDAFPYIPGLLSFREAPALVEAFQKLKQRPDLLFVDGHGIAHPRGLGIASHIGVLLDIPTIGVAKTILVGKPSESLGIKVGSVAPLEYKEKRVGMLLRSKANSNPLIISSGHRVSLQTAVFLVQSMLGKYRLPEPTRQAHIAANEFRKSFI